MLNLMAFALICGQSSEGPNLLTGVPIYWTDGTANGKYKASNGVHEFTIANPGNNLPWGIQIQWKVGPEISRSRLRLGFSHKGTPGMTFQVRCQEYATPFQTLGLDKVISTGEEWKQESFEFETPRYGKDFAAPILWLASVPGKISIRGMYLKNLGPVASQVTKIKSESDIFNWYDQMSKRFKAGDMDSIIGAWSAEYIEHKPFMNAESERHVTRQHAIDALSRQIDFKTEYSNGPNAVLLQKIGVVGNEILVEGYWNGSWRMSDGKGGLVQGGESFSSYFSDKWKKVGDSWRLFSHTQKDGYVDVTDAQMKSLKTKHADLKKQFTGP